MAQTRVLLGHVRGEKGDQGDPGTPGADSTVPGPPGEAATLSVGTTQTSAPGGQAQVTQTGTPQARVFNFTIPQGATGSPGVSGDPGVQFPPFYQMTGRWAETSGPNAYRNYINTATVPDWSLGDTNKILFLSGSFQAGQGDTNFMLEINGLGARQVSTPIMAPYGVANFGPRSVAAFVNQHDEIKFMPWRQWQIVRFTGSMFTPILVNDWIFNEISRETGWARHGVYYWHARWLTVNADTAIPSMPPRAVSLYMPNTAGTSRVIFKLHFGTTHYVSSSAQQKPWGIYNFHTAGQQRRIILRAQSVYNNPPAGTVRFQNHQVSRDNIWDDSNEFFRTVIFEYQMRVAKHLIDSGAVTTGAGYVDVPFPGGNEAEVEISYMFTWPFMNGPFGGMMVPNQMANMMGGAWGGATTEPRYNGRRPRMYVDILDIRTMQPIA